MCEYTNKELVDAVSVLQNRVESICDMIDEADEQMDFRPVLQFARDYGGMKHLAETMADVKKFLDESAKPKTLAEWREGREWFEDLEKHSSGAGHGDVSDPECGWGYKPGWIVFDRALGKFWTMVESDDYLSDNLAAAEEWLWEHFAKHEV